MKKWIRIPYRDLFIYPSLSKDYTRNLNKIAYEAGINHITTTVDIQHQKVLLVIGESGGLFDHSDMD